MTSDSENQYQQASLKLLQCLFEGDGDGAAVAFADILVARRLSVSDSALQWLVAAARGNSDTQN